MNPRLSSENLHATTVSQGGRAVVISGASGAGKSDLALRLIDAGFMLVSDDRTIVRKDGAQLIASAPDTIRGKLEVRGIGIVTMEVASDAAVALLVDLTNEIVRIPDDGRVRSILGIDVPVVTIDAMTASAPTKVALALNHLGLRN